MVGVLEKKLNRVLILWSSEVKQYEETMTNEQSRNMGDINRWNHIRKNGGYLKWAHARTRGKEVKILVITCIHVLNRRRLTVPLKEIPGWSIFKLFDVVAIYASKFFPVNIEQCSLLGLSCVSADSTMIFYYGKYLCNSLAITGHS